MEPSKSIDKLVEDLPDWRGQLIARLRKIILKADPEIVEEWKWDTPVWSHDGLVCAVGAFKEHVKVNFFKGASLDDPKKQFNAGLEAKAMRSIDFREGDRVDEAALRDLVRAAVAYNSGSR